MSYFIWGAGMLGKYALSQLGEDQVKGFIDSNIVKNTSGEYLGKKVYAPDQFSSVWNIGDKVMIAAQISVCPDIEQQLQKMGIYEYEIFRDRIIISFCIKNDDIIISNAFLDTENVFYIDLGANDPVMDSITKYLYAFHDAHGINVEPQPEYIELLDKDRKRDINICAACGPEGTATLYLQSGFSTICNNYRKNLCVSQSEIQVPCIPLRKLCADYVSCGQEIHFLKIDVEGYEKQVLLTADFEHYRPWIIAIESYHFSRKDECTLEPTYHEWEDILLSFGYHYVMQHNFDRYYVANEHSEMDQKLNDVQSICQNYRVINVY